MKLLCCSDLHLDDCTYGKIDKAGNTFRTLDHMAAFEWTVTQAVEVIKPDMFAIAGDIYESPLPPNNVREFFNHQIVRLSKAGILVRIIVGNHDCGKFHSALQPLRAIPVNGLSVCVDPEVEVCTGNMAGNTMLYLPYSMRVERKDITQKEHFMELASTWMEKAISLGHKVGDKTFFFGHFGVTGALMNDGHRNPGGDAMTLGDMEVMAADYSLLGDYHGYQPFRTSNGVVIIPGSLERTDFGDLNASKGFVVYNSEDIELPDTGKFRHVPYSGGRKFIKIEGDEVKIPELIEAHKIDGNCKGSVVKVIFNGTVTGYRAYEFTKKSIKATIEDQLGAILVMFEDRQYDPEQETKAAEIKEQIRKSPKMSEDDMEEITRKMVKLEISDEVEVEKAVATALEVMAQVKQDHGRNESAKNAMAVRIHGMKYHNFLRYGETDNVVELDVGAKEILAMPVKRVTWMKDIISNKVPDLFVKWNNDGERRVLSIVGMTDGDSKFSNGSGKCFAKNTMVLMYDGSVKAVQDIVVGDKVMGPDSKYRKVLETHSGFSDLYRVDQARGNSYTVNGEHILVLQTKDKKYNRYKTYHTRVEGHEHLHNVSVNEYLDCSKTFRHFMGGLQAGQIEFLDQEVSIDPYVLGIWLGDGHSSGSGITNVDDEVIQEWGRDSRKRGLKVRKNRISYHMSTDREKIPLLISYVYKMWSSGSKYKDIALALSSKVSSYKNGLKPDESSIHRWIVKAKKILEEGKTLPDVDLDIPIEDSEVCDQDFVNTMRSDLRKYNLINNKHIPTVYKLNSSEVRLKLLAGIIDTDGSKGGETSYDITLKSKALSEDIAFISRSLGFSVNIRPCKRTCANNGKVGDYWRISIIGEVGRIPVKIKRKNVSPRVINKNHLNNGIQVEPIGKGEYYGFEIDKDHMFLLDDFTIVHNSTILEGISYGFFERLVREFADSKERKGVSTNSIVSEINGEKKSEAFVEILFSAGGAMWLLRRGRKSNKDGSNHSPITFIECLFDTNKDEEKGSHSARLKSVNNEAISALIGMDYDTFSNSVMFGQNDSGKFIKGTDKMRKDILMNVLHLWMLEHCLVKFRDMKKEVAATLELLNSQVGILSSPGDDVESLNKKIVDIDEKLEECSLRIALKSADIDALRESMAKTSQDSFSKDVKSIEDEMSRLSAETSLKKSDFERRMVAAGKLLSEVVKEEVGASGDLVSTKGFISNATMVINSIDEAGILEELETIKLAKEARPKRMEQASGLTSTITVIARDIGGLENEIGGKNAEIKKLNSLKGQCGGGNKIKCSSCNSMVGEEHLDSEILKYTKEIADLNPKVALLKGKETDLKAELAEVKIKIDNCDTYMAKEVDKMATLSTLKANKDKLVELQGNIVKINDKIVALGEKKKEVNEEIKAASEGIAKVESDSVSEKTSIQVRIDEAKLKLQGVEAQVKALKDSIDDIDKAIKGETSTREDLLSTKARIEAHIQDVVQRGEKVAGILLKVTDKQNELVRMRVLEKAFGLNGIPSKIIERYMPLMNSYVAEYLDVISNHKIKARMSMEDSGEIRMGISGDGASTSELLSGGELVKIKLAFSIALGMLSFVRSAHTPEFICLDEIFAPVDIGTKDYVFQTIEKLKEHFRDIIVISHDTSLLNRIKSSIVVNKVDGISKIERQHHERIPEDDV